MTPSNSLGKREGITIMGELMPRPREAIRELRGADPLAPRLPVRVQRSVDRESAWGLVSAARAQAAAFAAEARVEAVELVTERAMFGLDRLHRVEAAMVKDDPIKAAQYSGLVDDFLFIARSELRHLPREF
jgi:hypothetical protein